MIFAAGLGTRLKPLTDTMPKALVPISGKPLLQHVLDRLSAAGCDDFVVNTHHFAEQIAGFLSHEAELKEGSRVRVSDEQPEALETGGGILHAEKFLTDTAEERSSDDKARCHASENGNCFLVHNVDILSDLDFGWFLSQTSPEALSTILVSERKTQRYFLFDEEMRLAGWTNTATGEVRSPYGSIDPDNYRKYAFAGIHCMSTSVFEVMRKLGFEGKFSIVDFYLKACEHHIIRGALPEKLSIVDVGKLSTLQEAEDFCRLQQA